MAKTAEVLVFELLAKEGVFLKGRNITEAAASLRELPGFTSTTQEELDKALRVVHANRQFPFVQKRGVVKGYRSLREPEREKLRRDVEKEKNKNQRRQSRSKSHYPAKRQQKQSLAPIPSPAY